MQLSMGISKFRIGAVEMLTVAVEIVKHENNNISNGNNNKKKRLEFLRVLIHEKYNDVMTENAMLIVKHDNLYLFMSSKDKIRYLV